LGVVALQTGRAPEAVALIQAAISRASGRAQYHFNLASALNQTGRPNEAIAACDQALTLQPTYPEAARTKATALIALGRLADAQAALDHALRMHPNDAETIFRRASVALSRGDFATAAAGFAAITASQPGLAQAHTGTGLALSGMDHLSEALQCFDEAVRLDPASADSHANRGLTLNRLGRHHDALAALEAAQQRQPDHPMALDNRGNTLRALGRPQEALASHDAALASVGAAAPYRATIHNNRGATLQALFRHAEALQAHEFALSLRPDDPGAHTNRATALQALGRHADALAAYDQAIACRPTHADAHANRGSLLQMTGHPDRAMVSFSAAMALRPDDTLLRFNASFCRLLLGDMEQGWRDFEYRWDHPLMAPDVRDLGRPRWHGETDGTILLHAEQGLGDTIQFCRYAPLVADCGLKVVLEVQPPLVRLLRRLDSRITVLPRGATLPRFDFQCPLMSLPLVLGPRLIPTPEGYLRVDPDRVARWRARLRNLPGRKVGLVWAGSLRHHAQEARAVDRRRSLALRRLAPLAHVSNITFISLQKGEAATQAPPPGLKLADFTDELADFEDTAPLIAALDLVISVDTAIVHLAGALDIPIWVLNRFDTCWRWQLGRTDSPWYRSVTLFRQPALGDWDSTIEAALRARRRDCLEETNGQAV
jgi:tetratricopeptide (TPR) repeat protein